jgi:hypothetical protein
MLKRYRQDSRKINTWVYLWIAYSFHINTCVKLTIQEGQRLVEAGLKELIANRHPEPYIPPFAPGGTAYQRNVPCPPEVVVPSLCRWFETYWIGCERSTTTSGETHSVERSHPTLWKWIGCSFVSFQWIKELYFWTSPDFLRCLLTMFARSRIDS